ncbi:MAG: IS66 family transposase [Planctomycetes bacterium]|nr:IS66 family transposase [Planctomycetota bacterium]
MIEAHPTIVELDMNKLEEILRRLEAKELEADDYETIHAVIGAYVHLVSVVGDKETTIRRLRQMLFGVKTEKTSAVIGGLKGKESGSPSPESESVPESPAAVEAETSAKADAEGREEADAQSDSEGSSEGHGHGRNGADAFTGAEKIEVRHESLAPGDPCPKCQEGTLYDTRRPGVVVRLVGQAPVSAMVYYLQKLRCNPCGALFTAKLPEGVDAEPKYDPTVGSMVALLKYGNGMPFHREEKLQESLGVPLSASTQWDIVNAQAERAEPVFQELARQAAQGDVVHNDDTGVKILEWMGERARQAALEDTDDEMAEGSAEVPAEDSTEDSTEEPGPDRTGMFTTAIVATGDGHKIALFKSGRRHAGENLKDVLRRRAAELPSPIQMCDALSRNLPGELKTIVANCLAHGRRRFVDVADLFPEECQHVLEKLAVVYHNDAIARERNLSPHERLLFHQAESGPRMEELHVWLVRQLDERRVEPNSALGKAISYLLRHWEKLTLFLRVAGAPLDNNICERALKKAIRHRRNSLFYKTSHGAHVGDMFMSLIGTCELCGANPFDYLTELDRHATEAASNPGAWMPWNYRETLAAPASPPGTAS